MILLFSIAFATFGVIGTLAAFGGETWTKDDRPLVQRITTRGWWALACISLAFACGVSKECLSFRAAVRAAAYKQRVDTEHRALLAGIAQRVAVLDDVVASSKSAGIDVPAVRANIRTSEELVTESARVVVHLALYAEERWEARDVSGALTGFLHAEKIAPIAELKSRIADCYLRLGDFQAAAEYGRAASTLAPQASQPVYVLAASLTELGNPQQALDHAIRSCTLGSQLGCELSRRLQSQFAREAQALQSATVAATKAVADHSRPEDSGSLPTQPTSNADPFRAFSAAMRRMSALWRDRLRVTVSPIGVTRPPSDVRSARFGASLGLTIENRGDRPVRLALLPPMILSINGIEVRLPSADVEGLDVCSSMSTCDRDSDNAEVLFPRQRSTINLRFVLPPIVGAAPSTRLARFRGTLYILDEETGMSSAEPFSFEDVLVFLDE